MQTSATPTKTAPAANINLIKIIISDLIFGRDLNLIV